jgi:hypothetical protein
MKASVRFFVLLVLAGLAGGSTLSARSASQPFTVTSSLDGKTVLPHRIHWLGFPHLPASDVLEVDFLIDGAKLWIEHKPPYTYSDDGGYLVTSWLSPGRHEFTVRAIARDGRRALHTVTARVLAPPDPPAALAGKWRRNVDASALPASDNTPSGVYTLTFEKRWIQTHNPGKFVAGTGPGSSSRTAAGWILDSDWTPGANRFHVQGSVIFRIGHPEDQEGGSFCAYGGPGADYRWSVSDATLTLTPIGGDTCRDRAVVWVGDWTRVR